MGCMKRGYDFGRRVSRLVSLIIWVAILTVISIPKEALIAKAEELFGFDLMV